MLCGRLAAEPERCGTAGGGVYEAPMSRCVDDDMGLGVDTGGGERMRWYSDCGGGARATGRAPGPPRAAAPPRAGGRATDPRMAGRPPRAAGWWLGSFARAFAGGRARVGTGRCSGGAGERAEGPWGCIRNVDSRGRTARGSGEHHVTNRSRSVRGRKRKGPATMPKAKGKGGKNRRRGKNDSDDKRELVFKDESQEYAQVVKMLGNGRLEAMCFDGEKRLAHIRGKLRKKVWINNGDIILLSLREFEDGKADVIQKYTPDEARSLKQYGELPETTKISEETFGDDEGGEIEFEEASDEEDEDLDDL